MKTTESDKLNQLLAEHYELQALFHNDVNIHAWFSMVYAGKCTLDEAMIGLVVTVTKEKRRFFDMIVKLKAHSTVPKMVVPDDVETN